MSNLKESLRFGESLKINDNYSLKNDKFSGRIIGEVTCNEYDKFGNLLFSSVDTNDVILPGSIFVLEQIFKTKSNNYRFLHPSNFPTSYGNSNYITPTGFNSQIPNDPVDDHLQEELVFGFMVGIGGDDGSSLISTKYEADSLIKSNGDISYIPIRKVSESESESETDPDDNGIEYFMKFTTDNVDYFYAKGFSKNPIISTKWADGSGSITEKPQSGSNASILTYAEVSLDINEKDVREYFGTDLVYCNINQLGLVAGYLKYVEDPKGLYKYDTGKYVKRQSGDTGPFYRKDFDDVKLVTSLNFKTKDLSNNENTLKFTYRIYCL